MSQEVGEPVFDVVGGPAVVFVIADNGLQELAIAGFQPLAIPVDRLGPIGLGVAPLKSQPFCNELEGVTLNGKGYGLCDPGMKTPQTAPAAVAHTWVGVP